MRKPKESENFTCRMEKETMKLLNQVSEETGLTKTVIVEKGILLFYERYKEKGLV